MPATARPCTGIRNPAAESRRPRPPAMSSCPSLRKFFDQLRHESLMSCGQRRHADDVHIALHREARYFAWSLEERTDIHVKANVGQCRGNHLGAAIVPILPHLGDQDARPAALFLFEFDDHLARFLEFFARWRRSAE